MRRNSFVLSQFRDEGNSSIACRQVCVEVYSARGEKEGSETKRSSSERVPVCGISFFVGERNECLVFGEKTFALVKMPRKNAVNVRRDKFYGAMVLVDFTRKIRLKTNKRKNGKTFSDFPSETLYFCEKICYNKEKQCVFPFLYKKGKSREKSEKRFRERGVFGNVRRL